MRLCCVVSIENGARVDLANREHCSVLRTTNVAHHVACVAALFAAGADSHLVDQRCIESARTYTTGVALCARSSHAATVFQDALLVCGGDLGAVVSPD